MAGASSPSQKGGGNSNGITTALGMAFLFLVAGSFTGCAGVGKYVAEPKVAAVTNVVHEITTNYVAVPVQVPGETRFITNTVPQFITNDLERVVYKTNWVLKSSIEAAETTAKVGVAVATTVAPPYGALAAGAMTIVSGILGGMVAFQNKKQKELDAAASQSQADADAANEAAANLHGQLQATIAGVENFAGQVTDEATAQKVKDSIAAASRALGVADDLHDTVKALTTSSAAKVSQS